MWPSSDPRETALGGIPSHKSTVEVVVRNAAGWTRTRQVLLAAALVLVVGAAGVALVGGVVAPPTSSDLHTTSPDQSRAQAVTAKPARARIATGAVLSVHIPATKSHFTARNALIYLPPAARTDPSARFPVVIAFGGQPGKSQDLTEKAKIPETMNTIAAEHHGIAPIVVMPDQMGPSEGNPMCVNSRLGNVDTYITVDVRAWIRHHLPVLTSRHDWTIAGFSEGGTCAITFGARHPNLFGALIDISGELEPRNGSLAHTLQVAFHGSATAYRRITPLALLRSHGPYPDTRAFFAVGAADAHYGPTEPIVADAARRAGMQTTFYLVPNGRHSWHTAYLGYTWALNALVGWLGHTVAPA